MFNATRFLVDQFNDADGVVGMLGKHCGDTPPKDTVRKWFTRGSISSEWFPLLLASLELESGEPMRLAQYISGEINVGDERDVFA